MMVTRKDSEAAGHVLARRCSSEDALAKANATVDDPHGVEIIGGGVRVPKIQEMLRLLRRAGRTSRPAELGLHLNGDEAPALGAAFHGANVSTSFRVRKVGMLDYAQHALGVRMTNDLYAESVREGGGLMGFFKGGTKKKDDSDESPEDWHKRATLFKAGARLGAKPRTIAFHHDADIFCELAYDDVDKLPPGTPKTVALANICTPRSSATAKQNTTGQPPRPKVQLFTLDCPASRRSPRPRCPSSRVRSRRAAAQGRAQGQGQRDGRERDRDQRDGGGGGGQGRRQARGSGREPRRSRGRRGDGRPRPRRTRRTPPPRARRRARCSRRRRTSARSR